MDYIITNSSTQDLFGLDQITIEELIKIIGSKPILGIDTETTGLNFLDDQLLMIQIYDGENNFVIDARNTEISQLNVLFSNPSILKLAHNMKFDYKFLLANGVQCENVYDTFLVEKIIHCGKANWKYALKDLLNRYFDIEMSKETRNTFIGHKGDFTKAQVLYGLDDVVKLLEIRDLQLAKINKMDLLEVMNLENKAVLVYADIEFQGIYLDKQAWEEVAVVVKRQIEILHATLDIKLPHTFPEFSNRQTSLFGGERPTNINWNSPTQVLKAFRNIDSKLDSVGAPALKYLVLNNDLIRDYVEYKEKSKRYNAYGPDFYKYLYSDGKVHTNFDQILSTGRISSRYPNLQQIPADNTYRNAFIPKDSDWKFVSSDFSAQELCIIAFGSQDPVWLEVLRNGGDLHSKCAELVFGKKWNNCVDPVEKKKLRTHVKIINFALAYGAGFMSIGKSLGIPEFAAKNLIKAYYKAFPRIKGFLEKLGTFGEKNRFIKTARPHKRIRHFDKSTRDKAEVSKIIRASKNTFVQGTAADMCKLALVRLREVVKNDDRVKIVLTVHDEINCICHKDYAEEFGGILSNVMEKAAAVIIGEGLLKCDVTISNKWEK